jgi:peroxiredoxin (alkyl hydroperoxide reductase subunit C)
MVDINDKAPNFVLKDQNDNEVSLNQYRGQPVLLAFFPAAWSPVCTDEMTCFKDDMIDLQPLGVQVLGISVDSGWTQKAWSEKLGLTFPVLSDFDKNVCRLYGTLRKEGFSDRAYFLINEHGTVSWKHVMPQPGTRLENKVIIEKIMEI